MNYYFSSPILCLFFFLSATFIRSGDTTTQPLLPLSSASPSSRNYGSISVPDARQIDIEEGNITLEAIQVATVQVADIQVVIAFNDEEGTETEEQGNVVEDSYLVVRPDPDQHNFCCISVQNHFVLNDPFLLPMSHHLWSDGVQQYLCLEAAILLFKVSILISAYCMIIFILYSTSGLNIRITPRSLLNYSVGPVSLSYSTEISDAYRIILWLIFATRLILLVPVKDHDGLLSTTTLPVYVIQFIKQVLPYLINLLILLYLSPFFLNNNLPPPVRSNINFRYFYIGNVLYEMNFDFSAIDRQMNSNYWTAGLVGYLSLNGAIQCFTSYHEQHELVLLLFSGSLLTLLSVYATLYLSGFTIRSQSSNHFVLEPSEIRISSFFNSNVYWYVLYVILASRLAYSLSDSYFTLFSKAKLSIFMYLLETLYILKFVVGIAVELVS